MPARKVAGEISRGLAAIALFAHFAACGGGSDDAGPPALTAAQSARVKFCNAYAPNGEAAHLVLELGQPAIKLRATSGACSSAPGAGCATLMPGAISVALRSEMDPDPALVLTAVQLGADQDWLFVARANADGEGQLAGSQLLGPGVSCATADASSLPP